MGTKKRPSLRKFGSNDKTVVHPTICYKLTNDRDLNIKLVNHYYRQGFSFKEIAELLNVSLTTVYRYYYGFASHCLSPYQLRLYEENLDNWYKRSEKVMILAQDQLRPTKRYVLVPIHNYVKAVPIPEQELRDNMPVPFVIRNCKHIYTGDPFSQEFKSNPQYGWETHDIVEFNKQVPELSPYVVMYKGACCSLKMSNLNL